MLSSTTKKKPRMSLHSKCSFLSNPSPILCWTAHHLCSLDIRDAQLYLGDGVGAHQLDQNHVGGVTDLRLDGLQLHELNKPLK